MDLDTVATTLKENLEIKDRKYHLRTYKKCFLGSDAVNWMLKLGITYQVEDAILIGRQLMEENLIYHVTKDADFENEENFYRFTEDDNTGNVAVSKDGDKISWNHVAKLLPSANDDDNQKEDRNPEFKVKDDKEEQINISTLFDEVEICPLDEHNVKLLDNVHPASWINPQGERNKYNLVVIGAGSGGLVSAAGASGIIGAGGVALIEKGLMGGDCLNVGCVPSKAIIRAARAVKDVKESKQFGVSFDTQPTLDFGVAMERLRKIRADISHNDSYERFSKQLGVHVYQGKAEFISKNEIKVGNKVIEFQKAIVATGGSAALPPIMGLKESSYVTNSTVFNMTELPPRMCVIGAGPIGLELAQAFALFGSKVTCFVRGKDILPKEDRDAAAIVHAALVEDGIDFKLNTKYVRVEMKKQDSCTSKYRAPFNEITVHVEIDGQAQVFDCEALLVATGRRPNVHGIGLEKAGIEFDDRSGVKINGYLQTTNKNVYAVGDVCTKYQFTHMSDFMARTAIRNAFFFGRGKHSALLVPWATYTEPEVAHVGLYERDMQKRGIEFDTYKKDFADVDRAICDGDLSGFVKIHCRKGTDEILGATIVNPNAGNMISEVTLAMQNKIGLGSIATVIHPYPTQAEAIRMCGDLYNKTRLTPTVKGLLSRLAKRSIT